MGKDLFQIWLDKREESGLVRRALTDTSYKNVDHSLTDYDANKELATYGDAIIKLCYAEIFLDNYSPLSKKIEDYVGDERFATIIAKHYKLIENKLIRIDESRRPHYNYEYSKPGKTEGGCKKESPDKFKATAVEAMIGAIYKETRDLNSLKVLLSDWINFK